MKRERGTYLGRVHKAFEINFDESEPHIINCQNNFFCEKKNLLKTVFNVHCNKPKVLKVSEESPGLYIFLTLCRRPPL